MGCIGQRDTDLSFDASDDSTALGSRDLVADYFAVHLVQQRQSIQLEAATRSDCQSG